jgi:hypothetical protein
MIPARSCSGRIRPAALIHHVSGKLTLTAASVGTDGRAENRSDIPMSKLISFIFAVTVFLGATLSFQIQPLISKAILPWFGGSPAVWTVCLLFFQIMLFAGYYYSSRLIRHFRTRGQFLVHSALLITALTVSIIPQPSWRPPNDDFPVSRILWLLTCHVGLPFLCLSASGPLQQVWFRRVFPGKSPWALYAFSNAGSFIGLLSVPFFLEIWFATSQQSAFWYRGFIAFEILSLLTGIIACRSSAEIAKTSAIVPGNGSAKERRTQDRSVAQSAAGYRGFCLLLALVPTVLLSAITSILTTDVSPVPFLWIVPLTIYLLTLVVCFSSEWLAARRIWQPASGILLLASGIIISMQGNLWGSVSLPVQFAVHLGTLAAGCMFCHGELVRQKPDVSGQTEEEDRLLTEFYLLMALGGAIGGFFTAVIAPFLFPFHLEYHLGLLAAAVVPAVSVRRSQLTARKNQVRAGKGRLATAFIFLLTSLLALDVLMTFRGSVVIARSFFGVSRVVERVLPGGRTAGAMELLHGTTRHGFQFLDPGLSRLPTTYYGITSGAGIAIQNRQARGPCHIGVVGLGVGTIAAYGRENDLIDFYEIDPVVRKIARENFQYLSGSPATVNVISGDARLALENQSPTQIYDVLILDAFSSDAVPVHLLTAEAFDVYRKHMTADAVLAIHISSQNFDLRPVLAGHARRLEWETVCILDPRLNTAGMTVPSVWVLMSPNKSLLAADEFQNATKIPMPEFLDWTDEKHSLFQILRRNTP